MNPFETFGKDRVVALLSSDQCRSLRNHRAGRSWSPRHRTVHRAPRVRVSFTYDYLRLQVALIRLEQHALTLNDALPGAYSKRSASMGLSRDALSAG